LQSEAISAKLEREVSVTVGWVERVRGEVQRRGESTSVDRALRWQLALVLIALTAFAGLAYQVSRRVGFRWDLYVWSESPFMTNMLKLSAGLPLYGPPSDANSFIYSPGLEYLTYALLRPLGLELDVRFCRAVTVAIGLITCFSAGALGSRLLSLLGSGARARQVFLFFAAALCALVVGKNFTADVCHPDNLIAGHVVFSLLLCQRAAASRSLRSAVIAVGFASLAVLAKQTGIAAGVCALVGLLLARPELRKPAPLLGLVAVTLGATALALLPLVWSHDARFWTFGIMAQHFIDIAKYEQLVRQDVLGVPHRAILWTLAPFAATALLLHPDAGPRRFALVWLPFGVGLIPALAAYLKHMGAWNNLMLIDVWAALGVLPVVWNRADAALETEPRRAAAPLAALLLLIATLLPTRVPPTAGHWAFGRELERQIGAACARGERVLLGHGTMALIRAGCPGIPLDRVNSLLELANYDVAPPPPALERIRTHFYDRIFFNVPEWSGGVGTAIRAHYRRESSIAAAADQPGSKGRERLDWHFGYQFGQLDGAVEILVPQN